MTHSLRREGSLFKHRKLVKIFFQEFCASLPFESSLSGSSGRMVDIPQTVDRDMCIHRSGARMSASLTFATPNRRGCTPQSERQDLSDRYHRRRQRGMRDKRCNCRHVHETLSCCQVVSGRTPRAILTAGRTTAARTQV